MIGYNPAMTSEEIEKLDAIALTVEAHRILGLTIERYESSPGHGRDGWREYTNWRAVYKDGSEWGRVYCDCDSPTTELLDKLNVENHSASWDSAAMLFEHESWPLEYRVTCDPMGFPKFKVENANSGRLVSGGDELAEVITRAFVVANHSLVPAGVAPAPPA